MNIEKAKELGFGNQLKDINICGIRLAESKFFGSGSRKDYRDEAIDFCIDNKIFLETTANNIYNMTKRFVRIVCPKCGDDMKSKGGSGDSHFSSTHYTCKGCKVEASIKIPQDMGLTFRFKDVQE